MPPKSETATMESLAWKVVSQEQTDALYECDTEDEVLSLLSKVLDVPFNPGASFKEDPVQALCDIVLDYYKYGFAFCNQSVFVELSVSDVPSS